MYSEILLIICAFTVGSLGHTNIRLDPDFNVMFHLSSVDRIEIEVTAATTGWVGFGFSHSASSNAEVDMVIGGVNGTNNETLYHGDYWSVNSDGLPTLDNQQDWFMINSSCYQNNTHTRMYYYRQLNTGDVAQDLIIPDNDVYLIWSYGASDTLEAPTKREVYHHQVNLVTGGSHGGSSVVHGSVATILFSVGLYVFYFKCYC